MSWWIYGLIAAVVLQRLAEVILANHNTAALLARGAHEAGASHYPVMIALHVSWLLALVLALPHPAVLYLAPLIVFALCQAMRLWVIHTLGPYWTTRIIVLDGAPLVKTGPYRFLRHPNYWVVVLEIAALPLAFGEWAVAALFSILNAMMLVWRIRSEDHALAARRAL